MRVSRSHAGLRGAYGIRTRATAVRGRRPPARLQGVSEGSRARAPILRQSHSSCLPEGRERLAGAGDFVGQRRSSSSARSCSYQGGVHLCALAKARMIARLVNMLRRRRARDLVLVAAVVALGGAALADALRDRTAEEARDGRAATAATTDEREASATTVEEAQAGQTPTTTTDEGEPSVAGCRAGPRRVSSPSPPPAPASFGPSMSARAECSTSLGWRRIARFTPRASGRASPTACTTTGAVPEALQHSRPRAPAGELR